MERRTKICIVVKAFLKHPTYTMNELAQLPEIKAIKVSSKTILKYLNEPSIVNLFGAETYNKIQKLLEQRTIKTINIDNEQVNENNSTFLRSRDLKEQTKMNHIYTFTKIHLKYPKMSFEKLAELYNQYNKKDEVVTSEYVEACLASKSFSNFFADNIWTYKPVYLFDDEEKSKGSRLN